MHQSRGRKAEAEFHHSCTEFHLQIQPTLPKQLNTWHGKIIFKSKRQPRHGLLCQLCVKNARKQGHNGDDKSANSCPQNFKQRNEQPIGLSSAGKFEKPQVPSSDERLCINSNFQRQYNATSSISTYLYDVVDVLRHADPLSLRVGMLGFRRVDLSR